MNTIDQIVSLANAKAHTEGYKDRKTGKFAYRKVDGPITPDMIAKHLDGSQPLGMYLNVDDELKHSHSSRWEH